MLSWRPLSFSFQSCRVFFFRIVEVYKRMDSPGENPVLSAGSDVRRSRLATFRLPPSFVIFSFSPEVREVVTPLAPQFDTNLVLDDCPTPSSLPRFSLLDRCSTAAARLLARREGSSLIS